MKGRKRHLVVDVLGMVMAVALTAASVQDRDGADAVLRESHREYPSLKKVWVDGAYNGAVIERVRDETGLAIEMVKRNDDVKGFVVVPKRWVVERTNGWLGAMTSLMLRRLTTAPEARKESR